ncbi:MAG TPA: spore coat U domain-containing protein [Pseudomonadales bacterium]|nr:spore coat U domain-containing protein [Pseudomonadales bacterium]
MNTVRAVQRTMAALALVLCWSCPADAAVDCSVTATGVAFGVYDPFAALPDDSIGTISVTCRHVPPTRAERINYTVTLSAGGSGAYSQRGMAADTSRLGYNLYADGARSQVWADGSSSSVTITGSMLVGPGVGNGTRTATHTIYGRIPARQDVAPGGYTDSIVVTLVY